MSLADERYVLLTTFRRDGHPVATPVWWADLGAGKYGFWTSSNSGKAKRLAHTARVTVQPCNARGVVTEGSERHEGSARVVSGPELETVRSAIKAKYGVQTKITKLMFTVMTTVRGKRMPYADCAVIVTL
jgi:PPOX class probable F420-dependent enzyme